jgi:hypothetical protein
MSGLTRVQVEANQIDLGLFRIAERLGHFADEMAKDSDRAELLSTERNIRAARLLVSKYMHETDRQTTE